MAIRACENNVTQRSCRIKTDSPPIGIYTALLK